MIANRQRGFINLYGISLSLIAVALLFVLALAEPWIPYLHLAEQVSLWSYALVVLVAMWASSGVLRRESHRLHALTRGQSINMALRQTAIVAACVFTLMFAAKDRAVSRLYLGTYLVLLLIVLTIFHLNLPRLLGRVLFRGNVRLRTLLVGVAAGPDTLTPWVRNRAYLGMQLVGYLTDDVAAAADLGPAECLGSPERLREVLRERRVNQVILLNGLDRPAELERFVETCEAEACRFLIHNSFSQKFGRRLIGIEEGGQSFFVVQDEPLEDPLNRMLKRTLDIVVSLPVCLVMLPPLMAAVWIVQRFQSPGTLFYIRPREGRQQRLFPMIKFRTMRDAKFDEHRQARADDERVYPFGRFLRKHSLDEFPQFFNVLKGEMTLVGPRPHLPGHNEEFGRLEHGYHTRSFVKPGITGMAQVQGYRGEITDREKLRGRIRGDLYYLGNWTIWMDLRIIALTALQVIRPPKSAY